MSAKQAPRKLAVSAKHEQIANQQGRPKMNKGQVKKDMDHQAVLEKPSQPTAFQ
jgi:hypothetical protein